MIEGNFLEKLLFLFLNMRCWHFSSLLHHLIYFLNLFTQPLNCRASAICWVFFERLDSSKSPACEVFALLLENEFLQRGNHFVAGGVEFGLNFFDIPGPSYLAPLCWRLMLKWLMPKGFSLISIIEKEAVGKTYTPYFSTTGIIICVQSSKISLLSLFMCCQRPFGGSVLVALSLQGAFCSL